MSATQQLMSDMKTAMKAGEKQTLEAIRYLLAQVKNAQIDKPNREDLTEEEFTKLVRKLVKNAEEAIQQYRDGGREDLVTEETAKLAVWKQYLPQPMSDDQVRDIAQEVIKSMPDAQMGPVIGQVVSRTGGRADGGQVSKIVRELLN